MMVGSFHGRAVVFLSALALAGCTAAHVSGEPAAPGIYAMSSGRLGALAAALLGLIAVVSEGLALARSASRVGSRNRRRGAMVAMPAGLIAVALGGLVVFASTGGVGTGGGVGGAIVAMVLGLTGVVLGGLALARSAIGNGRA